MRASFEQDFQKLGLSDKEAKVYWASLELGPSPVQVISRKAGVNRATTYVMIESLTDRGLIGSVKKGKKTLFVAEHPEQLSRIVDVELNKAHQKKQLLDGLLPKLATILDAASEKPRIEMFEGLDGLRTVHEDLIAHGKKFGSIENIAAVDDARDLVLFDDISKHWEEIAKQKIKVRSIITQSLSLESLPEKVKNFWEERRVSKENFPFHGELVIYGNKVAALAYRGKIVGVIIESQEIAQTVRVLFELAWIGSEKHLIN